MRIVIDMQAVQSTGSRNRGIGRYSLSLAQAMVRNVGEHEILLALNGLFPETIEPIRAAFDGLLPQANIRVWHAVGPVDDLDRNNHWRRQSAEMVREAFLASLKPDIVHVTSVFEGLHDDAITSVGAFCNIPTAITFYDLIPFIHRSPYLDNPPVEAWYLKKLEHFRRADLWLAISESSRQEGLEYLNLPDDRVVNVSTAADAYFQRIVMSAAVEHEIRQKYRLLHPFVMYTGGVDHRKNIEGLIRAFSALSLHIRREHQLAIVCSARPEDKQNLLNLAKKHGLTEEDIILTGFVPEEDLVALYNLCKLFIFPSWHEGFGLPALEAMQCGAPVIGANTSSLPEVIGWDQALFDPHSDEAIAIAMARALGDEAFRSELTLHGKLQAKKFSWDETAKRAITTFERFHAERKVQPNVLLPSVRRPKLAYVSPLPSSRTGIADYSAELLPELARHYEIEVIIAQTEVSDAQVKTCWPIRTVEWFAKHAAEFDRVLYHFGNSSFHSHMFDLLVQIPGVVVLHDFFLAHVIEYMDGSGLVQDALSKELYHSHGYNAVNARFHTKDIADVAWQYPCNLSVLQNSLGVIVHSENSLQLARHWYGHSEYDDWAVIPLMRQPAVNLNRIQAKIVQGFKNDDFLVCSFGLMGPTKLNHRLLDAWIGSSLHADANCHLVFVGENSPGDYSQQLLKTIRRSNVNGRIRITGWADMGVFREFLTVADVGVQLRTLSRGETSAAVLDCMNYGLATIVNANGSMADLPDTGVWKLPDEFTDQQLVEALEALWQDHARRIELGITAREIIRETHNPRRCADQYYSAIERHYCSAATGIHALSSAIANIEPVSNGADLIGLAEVVAKSLPVKLKARQLLVDVSVLVHIDGKSGIQRVVRSILLEWLINPPDGYRIEPVYAIAETKGYRYARQFTLGFLGCPVNILDDEPVEFAVGDVFLGLDLQPNVVCAQQDFYQKMRNQGVTVKFVVYDLLPLLLPNAFVSGVTDMHVNWLKVVTQSDGAICISKAVAYELTDWINKNGSVHQRPFIIDWFHLGADIDNSTPSKGLPTDAQVVLGQISGRNSFLLVGTLEPRKGHAQVLEAFERLWQTSYDVNLVIVGKQGWMVEALVEKLRTNPELNKRLFWLEGISDEYLEQFYAASTCLIAASYGEGFGLPLIEAAQHKLPILARDIPVFREVAGEHAFYLTGTEANDLAEAIKSWCVLFDKNQHPTSEDMPWLTWKESADRLKQILIGDTTY
jgi:glycosyltransferase involved in cell wall biosynthesis